MLETIREECEYNYNEKLKSSLKLLFDCLKCSSKSNQGLGVSRNGVSSYGSANASGSGSPRNNFLTMEMHLPAGMFPKVKIP